MASGDGDGGSGGKSESEQDSLVDKSVPFNQQYARVTNIWLRGLVQREQPTLWLATLCESYNLTKKED